jgi:hypothetical protein
MRHRGISVGLGVMVWGLLSLGVSGTPATAAPVTFQFAGHLTEVDPTITTATGFTVGHTFTGSYIFESTAPELPSQIPNPRIGAYEYSVTNVTARIGTQIVVMPQQPGFSTIVVLDNAYQSSFGNDFVDQYGMSARVNAAVATPWHVESLSVILNEGSSFTFDNDSLPTHPPSLGSFGTRQAFFNFFTGTTTISAYGQLTSLTAVPVPAAILLFGTGLTALIGLGTGSRRRKLTRVA